MNRNQKGFAILETLLLLAIMVVIAGIGWYAVNTKHQTDRILSQADKISQSTLTKSNGTSKKTKGNSTADQSKNNQPGLECPSSSTYLVIKEWGIKIKMNNSDTSIVCYRLSNVNNCLAGPCEGTAALSLNAKVTTNCEELGIGIERRDYNLKDREPAIDQRDIKQVGNYWYDATGGTGSCGDAMSDAIRSQYLGNNTYSWEYSGL